MSTVAGSRHRSRESQERRKVWKDPNLLEIPPEVLTAFRTSGYGLRWIRHTLGNEADGKNVLTRQREGYEFVTAAEVEPFGWVGPPTIEHTKYGSLISIGDLVLAKIDLDIAEDRDRQMADRTRRITQGVNEALYENARENRLLPIRDSSRSQTTTGGSRQVIVDNDDTDI